MAGVHAQVPSAAEHSLALRVSGATRSDVRRALESEELVRTFGPRGTVHLLPAADLGWWMAALGSIPSRSPFAEAVRFSASESEVVVSAIGSALAAGELTVDELTVAVGDLAGGWAVEETMPAFQGFWPRWRQLTAAAAYAGELCFGAGRGRQVTYRRPPAVAAVELDDVDEAVGRLVTAYLRAFGPGTAEGFAPWVGAPAPWAQDAFERYAGEEIEVDGVVGRLARGDVFAADAGDADRSVLLLPYFDAYVVGARPRPLVYPGRATERALTPSGQAGNYPVLLIDGVVEGVWHGRRTGRRIAVTVEPLSPLAADVLAGVEDAVQRLGEVVEAVPTLTIGPVAAGPHA